MHNHETHFALGKCLDNNTHTDAISKDIHTKQKWSLLHNSRREVCHLQDPWLRMCRRHQWRRSTNQNQLRLCWYQATSTCFLVSAPLHSTLYLEAKLMIDENLSEANENYNRNCYCSFKRCSKIFYPWIHDVTLGFLIIILEVRSNLSHCFVIGRNSEISFRYVIILLFFSANFIIILFFSKSRHTPNP